MRMAKSKKPPLSAADMVIYGLVFIVLLLAAIGPMVPWFSFCDRIGREAHEAVARSPHISFVFCFLLYGHYALTVLLIFWGGFGKKEPIFFPKKGIRYGKYPYQDYYPLFSKDRPSVNITEETRRSWKKILRVWVISLVICAALAPLGFYGQDCLTADHRIEVYNCLDRNTATYRYSDIRGVELFTSGGYRGGRYVFSVRMTMEDGEEFRFANSGFDSWDTGERLACIETMQEIRNTVPPECVTVKDDHLDQAIHDQDLNETEAAALRRLFGQG